MNLVLAAEARHALLHFFQRVGAADGFNRFFFVMVVAVAVALAILGVSLAGWRSFYVRMVAGFAVSVVFRHRRRIDCRFAGDGSRPPRWRLLLLRFDLRRGRLVSGHRRRGLGDLLGSLAAELVAKLDGQVHGQVPLPS